MSPKSDFPSDKMQTPENEGREGCSECRGDSPICYIHFSHPFVYLETPDELEDSYSTASDDGDSELEIPSTEDATKDIPSVESLLPFERALEGPSRDLLTQILFPDLNKSEAQGSLREVLKMLREAWSKSRPNSGSSVVPQRQKTTSSRRRLSAPETRIRRFTVKTTTTTTSSDNNTQHQPTLIHQGGCKSAPPAIMCTDSIICQDAHNHHHNSSNMINKYNNCYCHTFATQNEFKFSCKLNFEENMSTTTTRYKYNCNYIENNRHINDYSYVPKLIPRYSSLPRTLSMLNNCSSPSTSSTSSCSSSDNDEECQSLADSLEDMTRINPRLTYDEKPVRGGPPLLPHRHAPRAPVPKGETFFIPLSDRNNELIPIESSNNNEFILPQNLKEKLEKRKQELLENKPKINRSVVIAQKSPRPVRSRRVLGTKFQRFECIPEELEPRRGRNRFPASRTYVPRAPLLATANRGLQAIVRDNHEAKIGLQDQDQRSNKPGLQGVLPITSSEHEGGIQDVIPLQRNKQELAPMSRNSQGVQGILPVPRGKQAMGEQDLVAVTTGWVNFYMLRGEEQSGSSDNTTGSGQKSGRWSGRGRSRSRGASVTEVSVSGRSSTVRVQQQPRPRTLTQRRMSLDHSERNRETSLPRLPPASAGDRSTNGQQGTILPSLSRANVPMIRVKHPTNEDSLTSDNGSVSLPALPPALAGNASTSSSDTPRIRPRGKSSSSSSGPRSQAYVPSTRRNNTRQSRQALAKANNTAVAVPSTPTTTTPPGTWSVTVTGVCPQPEMEVRLVFPPSSDSATPPNPAVTSGSNEGQGSEVIPAVPGQISQQSDSGLGEENNGGGGDPSRFTLMFKNNNNQAVVPNASASRGGRRASAISPRRGSPIISPKRRNSLKALPSTEMAVAEQQDDLSALDNMMWPEMQTLLQEQVINIKKQHTITRSDMSSGGMVERLRGGEGVEQIQQVQQLSVRGAAITTRRKKRNTS